MKTLRSRVLLGTSLAVTAVLAVAGWVLYALVERALVGEIDRALETQACALSYSVSQTGTSITVEFVEYDMADFTDPEQGESLQLWAPGYLLYSFPEVEEPVFEPSFAAADPTSGWVDLGEDARGRRLTYQFTPVQEGDDEDEDDDDLNLAHADPAQLAIVLTTEASAVDQALATLRMLLGVVGVVTIATACAVLVGVVRRSLRPVALVSDRVAAIGEESLSTRLDPGGVPGELLPVVQRINGLLGRLEAAFLRERAFSSEVAHELRTPLAGLLTTLEVTAKRSRSQGEYVEALEGGASIARQLQSMVERLLQLARLEGSRVAIDSEPYLLGEVAVETWEPFAGQAVERDLRVDLSMEHGLEVSKDRELVEVICRNLYDNAVSYADSGGEVRITARRSGAGLVSLEVSNTGSSLSQEDVAAATQRFWRGDAARTEAGLHCGLGLALVEKAAGALDGEISLRSRDGGEFAVEVKFPA